MTDQRWWAPTDAHLGPDQVDLAMLDVTGEDPRLDLGGVLLAAHRVGDAACRVAASEPICDEGTLINALAKARSLLAEPMVSSVSKCVHNSEDSYAGLLVRDVLDEADETTVGIFRAAVARGVAPPVAASRAGAVYGVPAQEVGKYRQLALDPRAQVSLLGDTADRVLFGYFATLAAEESGPETIGKAEETATETRAPKTHIADQLRIAVADEPRDDHGRWTSQGASMPTVGQPGMLAQLRQRYGIGGQSAPEVATERPSETAAADAERKERLARLERLEADKKKKKKKKKPAPKPVEQTAATLSKPQLARAAKLERNAKLRRKNELSQKAKSVSKADAATFKAQEPQKPKGERLPAFTDHWLMTPFEDTGFYRSLDDPMSLVVTDAMALQITEPVATSVKRRLRAGHLIAKLGGKPEPSNSKANSDQLENATYAHEGGVPIEGAHMIGPDEIPEDAKQNSPEIAMARMEAAEEYGDDEDERTSVYPEWKSANDLAGDVTWVAYTRSELGPPPIVFEFQLHDAKGVFKGTRAHMDYQIDPNQVFEVDAPDQWETYFDLDRAVIVRRVNLRAVDVEKATLTPPVPGVAVADDPSTAWWDARDTSGRFAAGPATATEVGEMHEPVEEIDDKAAAREQRLTRLARLERLEAGKKAKKKAKRQAAKPTSQPASQAASLSRGTQLNRVGLARVRMQDKIDRQVRESSPPLTAMGFNLSHAYAFIDPEDLEEIRYDHAGVQTLRNGVIEVRKPIPLLDDMDANVIGEDIAPKLRQEFFDLQMATDGYALRGIKQPTIRNVQDQVATSQKIMNMQASGAHGLVGRVPQNDDGSQVAIQLSSKPATIVAIEFEAGLNNGSDYDLVPMSEHVHSDWTDPTVDGDWTGNDRWFMTMRVQRYLAVKPEHTAEVLAERDRSSHNDR